MIKRDMSALRSLLEAKIPGYDLPTKERKSEIEKGIVEVIKVYLKETYPQDGKHVAWRNLEKRIREDLSKYVKDLKPSEIAVAVHVADTKYLGNEKATAQIAKSIGLPWYM